MRAVHVRRGSHPGVWGLRIRRGVPPRVSHRGRPARMPAARALQAE